MYARSKEEGRKYLWENLKNVAQNIIGGGLLGGGFNVIKTTSEKEVEPLLQSQNEISFEIESMTATSLTSTLLVTSSLG